MNIFLFVILLNLCFCDDRLFIQPPFLTGLNDGMDKWKVGGSATVLENFIRLTPLENSKRGYIWSTVPNKLANWQATFEFSVCCFF